MLTLHDLIHLDVPAETSVHKRVYYEKIVRPAVRETGRVFTVSEFSRRRVAEWAGLDADQVVNVGVGCSFPTASEDELLLKQERERDEAAVLFVGNGKPHKNLGLALQAIARLPTTYRFVTVGVDEPTLRQAAASAGVPPERIDRHMGVTEDALRGFYLAASCVAMPSVYEALDCQRWKAWPSGRRPPSSRRLSARHLASWASPPQTSPTTTRTRCGAPLRQVRSWLRNSGTGLPTTPGTLLRTQYGRP